MTRRLTDEERQRMGLTVDDQHERPSRGWSNEQIKNAIYERGLTIAEFERQAGLSNRAVRDALKQRSPKTDKMIAAFLDVHESVIWPNRYLVTGASMPKVLDIENKSDEFLAEYNRKISGPKKVMVVRSWVGGPDGGPIIEENPVKNESSLNIGDLKKNADGTVNHPWYDQPSAPDLPVMANERQKVSLPPRMNLDEKS